MEGLKSTLKEQDEKIENLKEKVNILESQVIREYLYYMFPCWYMPGYVYVSVCLHVNDTLPHVHTLENGCVPV